MSFKKIFWAGLIFTLILLLLIGLCRFVYDVLGPLRSLLNWAIKPNIPGLEFAVILLVILILGAIAQLLSRRASSKIPILNKIVKFSRVIHDIAHRLDTGEIKSVRVRLNDGLYLLGFTTGEPIKINGEEMIAVLLPSTFNPTTGYCFIVPKEKITYLPSCLNPLVLKIILTAGLIK